MYKMKRNNPEKDIHRGIKETKEDKETAQYKRYR